MKTLFAFAGMLMVSLVGCAAQPDSEEADTATAGQSALEESWSSATPTVFAIEQPLDFNVDWSEGLEVQDPLDPDHEWRAARTVTRPEVSERPANQGSGVIRQLQHGFGSGPCRPRANPFRREIGIMCKWTF